MMFYPSREQQLSEQFGPAPTSLATFKETISGHIFSGISHAINIAPFGHFFNTSTDSSVDIFLQYPVYFLNISL